MAEEFKCIQDGNHNFVVKSRKGVVCSHCGLISVPGSVNSV
jgi:hypothetical protein